MTTDYYKDSGSKIGDFFVGFIVNAVSLFVYVNLVLGISSQSRESAGGWVAGGGAIIGLVVEVWTMASLFRTGRRFIAIGMLSALLPPLLALGACFVILSNLKF